MDKERAEAQLEIMREVKSAWSKGDINFLWILKEIERLEEDVLEAQTNEILKPPFVNNPIEGEIHL